MSMAGVSMNTNQLDPLFTRLNIDAELQEGFKPVADENEIDSLVADVGSDMNSAGEIAPIDGAGLSDNVFAEIAGGHGSVDQVVRSPLRHPSSTPSP
jgi:hypothetical protein